MRIIFKQREQRSVFFGICGCFFLLPSYITGGSYILLGTLFVIMSLKASAAKEGGWAKSEMLFIKVEI